MADFLSKGLSAGLCLVYLVAAFLGGGPEAIITMAFYLALPLACIWFSEEMGLFTGPIRGSVMTSESPPYLVSFGGWVLMILPFIIAALWHFPATSGS